MKRKLMFLFMAFILTFMLVVNVKAEEVTCTGSKWVSGAWSSYESGTSAQVMGKPTCNTSGTSYTETEVLSPGNSSCGANISSGCHRSRTWTKSSTVTVTAPCCEVSTGRTIEDNYGCNACGASCSPGACPTITITCTNPTYNTQSQPLATCTGGNITKNGSSVNAGTWTVECTSSIGTKATKSCSMSKQVGQANFGGATITVGESKTLSANGTGTITYTLVSGDAVTLSGDTVTGVKAGTAIIRATAAESTNYTSATKDAVITVTEEASEDKCFCNPTGTGCEFRKTNANNWVPIAGITDAATCTTYASNNQNACFTNGTDYSWRSVAEGWTIVPGVGTQEACESMHYTDPTSGKYSLSCPKNQLKVGDTMVCTYTTDTDSPLASAHVSSNNISATVSGNKITVKGERLGGGGVYGKAQNGNATNNVQVAVVEEYSSDSCSISISTSSVHTSQTNDDVDNDYYIVNVVISGNGCNGGTANFTASNAKTVTPSSLSLANMGASKVTTFKVYPIACRQSRAHATVSYANGTKTASSNYTQSVEILGDWKKVSGTFCETNPSYTDFMSADAAGSNVYFSDRKTCADGTTVGYTVKWTRGGCGGTTTETDKCYKDKQTGLFVCGKYASQTSRYTYIADDCNSNACKNPTEPVKACYKNKETGKYKYDLKDNLPTPVENWVYVDLDETHCKDKEETPACYYIDETGKYAWGLFEDVAGYIKTTLTREQCVNPEPVTGCYKNLKTNEFAWGDYDDDNNYEYIESITAKEKCKSACFKCKDDEYLWGGYDEYGNKCELVPNIITPDSCKPVPPTAATISKIVYALSLFLVMAGTGIIVYQLTKTKKTLD